MISATDRETLAQIPIRFSQAWNRKNAEGVFADYAEDADFIDTAGLWWRGKERLVEEHADRFATVLADSVLLFREVSVRELCAGGAIVHGQWSMKGHQHPNGHWAPVCSGILTFVARRDEDGWKIVASHNTDIAQALR